MTSKPTTIFCFLGRKYNKQHIRGKIFDMRMRKFSGIMCMYAASSGGYFCGRET